MKGPPSKTTYLARTDQRQLTSKNSIKRILALPSPLMNKFKVTESVVRGGSRISGKRADLLALVCDV